MKLAFSRLFPLLAFFLAAASLAGQDPNFSDSEGTSENRPPKTATGISFGTSYVFGFEGYSLFSQSASPFFRHWISNRFLLFAGAELAFFQATGSNSPLFPVNGIFQGGNPVLTRALWGVSAFVGGVYKINQNLSLFGSTWINRNNIPSALETGNGQLTNSIIKGISMNLEFKLSESFRIGAGFSVSERPSPFILPNSLGSYRGPSFLWPGW